MNGYLLKKFRAFINSGDAEARKKRLKRFLSRPAAFIFRKNIKMLSWIYGSDKWGTHWYAPHYERHFSGFRRKKAVVLEIGIGGYSRPQEGGGSLRVWKSYFRRGKIYGIDIYDKSPHDARRIRTFKGDQTDPRFLAEVIRQIGAPHIIIDDGSHMNEHNIKTFEILFPLLRSDGIYVVEDVQTSYWPGYGGSSIDPAAPTAMNYFKKLADGLNYREFVRPGYKPSYTDTHIVAMDFYHNMVFIRKGVNDENSTRIKDNMPDPTVM